MLNLKSKWPDLKKKILHPIKTRWQSIIIFILAILVTVLFGCLGYGDITDDPVRPKDEIIRNYGLLVTAFWGAFLAVWRSQIAGEQAKSALRQAETSERGLRNERFQKGAEMLGSNVFTVRMGGIHALDRLAQDRPEDYLDQIIKLLSAFVRHPTYDEQLKRPEHEKRVPARPDVTAVVQLISTLNTIDVKHNFPNFNGADLRMLNTFGVNLQGARLTGANLFRANVSDANLMGADFTTADLAGANFANANLTGANFIRANISDVNFSEVMGLDQKQLDQACQRPQGGPPKDLPSGLVWDERAAIERWKVRKEEYNART